MNQFRVNGSDKKTSVMEMAGDGFIISAGILQDNTNLAVQAFQEGHKLVEIMGSVGNLKGRGNYFTEGLYGGYHTFSFGYIDSDSVHLHSSSQKVSNWLHPALLLNNLLGYTNAPESGGSTCLKRTAAIRGWLTVCTTDVVSPKIEGSGQLPSYCNLGCK
ncbi:hypothetical protein SDC9_123174 [bioreactor metagenome]|uniref:Uncharacterized protein n=1 Tax=bioreactor metagenome TaxID=1076179 RepID=A0A645CH06_9ZZZZ